VVPCAAATRWSGRPAGSSQRILAPAIRATKFVARAWRHVDRSRYDRTRWMGADRNASGKRLHGDCPVPHGRSGRATLRRCRSGGARAASRRAARRICGPRSRQRASWAQPPSATRLPGSATKPSDVERQREGIVTDGAWPERTKHGCTGTAEHEIRVCLDRVCRLGRIEWRQRRTGSVAEVRRRRDPRHSEGAQEKDSTSLRPSS